MHCCCAATIPKSSSCYASGYVVVNKHAPDIVLFIAIAILVHLLYVFWIWPSADQIQIAAAQSGGVLPRSLPIILKDFEQELCIIIFLFASIQSIRIFLRQKSFDYLFAPDFLKGLEDSERTLNDILVDLEGLPRSIKHSPLINTLSAAIRRLVITGSVQNASDATQSAVEALSVKNENELAYLKYLVWAVPSIGFVGTVRGIGIAMSQAESAVAGDIGPMTASLGVAFNSTFVALLISLILMLLLTVVQREQDSNVEKVHKYCEEKLIERIS